MKDREFEASLEYIVEFSIQGPGFSSLNPAVVLGYQQII